MRLRTLSRRLLGVSVGVYATGVFFACLWPLIYLSFSVDLAVELSIHRGGDASVIREHPLN